MNSQLAFGHTSLPGSLSRKRELCSAIEFWPDRSDRARELLAQLAITSSTYAQQQPHWQQRVMSPSPSICMHFRQDLFMHTKLGNTFYRLFYYQWKNNNGPQVEINCSQSNIVVKNYLEKVGLEEL